MKTVRLDDPCNECLLDGCFVEHHGDTDKARFLVVSKGVSEALAMRDMNMGKSAMRMFAQNMKENGFAKNDFVFTNAIRCGYDSTEWRAKDRHVIEKACREHLIRLIEEMRPEVVIPLGADAASAVMGRKVKINKVRGVPEYHREFDTYVVPMLDPWYATQYPQNLPIFASDCKTLKRLVDHDYDVASAEKEVLGDYRIVTDLQYLIDNPPERLSFDLETLGTRPHAPEGKILTMQFCTEPGVAQLLSWDHPDMPMGRRQKRKVAQQLKRILQNPDTSVFGQNLKFDALWVLVHLGFRFRIDDDSLMLAALVDENALSKDLDTLTKLYVPHMAGYADSFNQRYDKARMDLVPLSEIVGYGCGDVDAGYQVCDALLDIVEKDDKLYTHYRRVSMPGINAFLEIDNRGMMVDEEALDEFEEVLAEYVEDLRVSLMQEVPRSIKRKHAKKGLKFSRSDFVLDILFNHSDGFQLTPRVYTKTTENLADEFKVPSLSSKDHLPYFFDECPFTVDLAEYMKMSRLLGTNVRRFRENYIIDGKIHPIYNLTTAVTGRTSSRDPNGQNFPKRGKYAKAYRKIFKAPPGYVILEADLSQAELRIAADMANDPVMLNIYQNYGDIHKETALIVTGMSMEELERLPKDEQGLARFKAKAVNFGFLYGMGWRKFIVYAKTQYGVEFTEQEAQRIRTGFFRKFSALPAWHDSVRAFAQEHGYVRSYDGRVRHLPMIWSPEERIRGEASRQAINSPVQNFASDLGVMSMARIDAEIDPEYLAVTGFVHDALYALVREEHVEWGAKVLKHYMETNPLDEWFNRRMKLPIVADVGFGWNGGETFEMDGLKLDEPYDFDSIRFNDDEELFNLPIQTTPPNWGRVEQPDYLRIEI